MRKIFLAVAVVVAAANQLVAGTVVKEKYPTPIAPNNVRQLHELTALQRDAFRLDWVPVSGVLAVMPLDAEIEVFDPSLLKPIRKLAVGKRLVEFAFSRNGDRLAWSENNVSVTIEDLKTSKMTTLNTGNNQPSADFSPDGKWLVTGGYGDKAGLWEVATGKKIRDFTTNAKGGLRPVFSPDGKIVAIGDRNSDTRLFEPSSGKLLHVLPKTMTHEIRFNPAGKILATTYVDSSIGLWDVANGKSLNQVKTAGDELYTVDWSPKGDLLVTAGRNGKIILWDAKELKSLKELNGPEWVISARFSPDGSRLLTAGGAIRGPVERKITIWGLDGDQAGLTRAAGAGDP
jgi:WD40 repeat protein